MQFYQPKELPKIKGKKLFILELNEFNHKLLKYYSKKYNLNNLNKVLKFNTTKTYTSDRYIGDNNQFGYLDPWSQWVSIHTQKKAKIHKIKNLGDVPSLKYKQVWEKRSEDFSIDKIAESYIRYLEELLT